MFSIFYGSFFFSQSDVDYESLVKRYGLEWERKRLLLHFLSTPFLALIFQNIIAESMRQVSVAVVGNSRSGKTQLINRFTSGCFTEVIILFIIIFVVKLYLNLRGNWTLPLHGPCYSYSWLYFILILIEKFDCTVLYCTEYTDWFVHASRPAYSY